MIGSFNGGHQILLVADEENIRNLLAELKASSSKDRWNSLAYYNLKGRFGTLTKTGELLEKSVSCHRLSDGIVKVIRETNSNEVFITASLPYHTIVDTVLSLGRDDIKFLFSPEAHERCTGWVGRTNSWILPAIDLNTGNLPPFYRMAKRCMDILVSILILIVFLPLFVIIPILIKLMSRGPVFYTQMRGGHNGRPFKIYKFRSMVPDAERMLSKIIDINRLKEPVFKLKDDPRITRIGKILRKTSIDELPQLFNVIKGDLSLVGPRPEDVVLVKRYNPYFMERLKVKPGITGLQQVTCRGSKSLKERVKYDLAYIKKRSLWLDIKILFRTIWVVLLLKRAT